VKRLSISTLLLLATLTLGQAPLYAHSNNGSQSQKQANKATKKYNKQQAKLQKKEIKKQNKDSKKYNKQHPRVTTT